jgi:hypothetical protein
MACGSAGPSLRDETADALSRCANTYDLNEKRDVCEDASALLNVDYFKADQPAEWEELRTILGLHLFDLNSGGVGKYQGELLSLVESALS